MSFNSPRSSGAALMLIATLCVAPIGYAEVPFTFSPGQPARAAEVNENFSSLNERLDELERLNAPDMTFNYVIVDADSGVQVGVYGGPGADRDLGSRQDVIYKLEMVDGSTNAWLSRMEPSSLPQVATDTRVATLYHTEFWGMYSCVDLSSIGWHSRWAEYDADRNEWNGVLAIPEQEFTQVVARQFGAMPSGDVVLAEVEREKSVSWGGDYSDIPCLDRNRDDPDAGGQWGCPPSVVPVDCAIHVFAYPQSQGFTAETWPLRVPTDAAFSVVSPYAWSIEVFAQSSEVADSALALCNEATGGRCAARLSQVNVAYTTRAATPHVVSYTSIESVTAVTPIGSVPGNRGEPRTFRGEFR